MRLEIPQSAATFEVAPAGTFPAVCVAVIDLGTHEETFKNQETGEEQTGNKRKVYLAFEIARRNSEGDPFLVGRAYTLSDSKLSKLLPVLEALLGPKDDWPDGPMNHLHGKQALVSVKHAKGQSKQGEARTYANLNSVMAPLEGQPEVDPISPIITYDIGDSLPEGLDDLPRIYGVKVSDFIRRSQEMGNPF